MIKNLFFVCAIFFATSSVLSQETRFGITAGYLDVGATSKFEGVSASAHESGFYMGALADIALSPSWHLQPGVNYGFVEDSGVIYVPVMAKYYIAESGFNLQAGPQATILTEDTGSEIKAFGLDLGFGAAYDINESFFIEAKYALELTNRLTSEFTDVYGDVNSRLNSLFVGVGYKF